MQELMKFEGNNVEVIQDENGNLLFEIYSTGMALGYARNNGKSAGEHCVHPKLFPYKSRIDKVISNAEITPVSHGVKLYLNESQLYDFMLEARTDKCRTFRKWVTNEVLPSINKTGSYSIPSSPPAYKYIDKTYRGKPVLTAADIIHLFRVNPVTLYKVIKTHLTADSDCVLLQGLSLREYLNENSSVPRCRKSIYIIFKSGFDKLAYYFGFNLDNVPQIMTQIQTRGYVVQDGVRNLMEYIRRELKGVEALTYLLESDDTPSHLEQYRDILEQKLDYIQWWKMDVKTIRLGIHNITGTELSNIHNGVCGMKY